MPYHNHPALDGLALGKKTEYHDQYDPTLLQAVPRSMNREPLALFPDSLPFHGSDIWTLYEVSWLNQNGVPQVAIADVEIDATSPNLIESKSFKLYLNSFNQMPFSSWQQVEQILQKDLAHCAQGNVQLKLHRLSAMEHHALGHFDGINIDEQNIVIQHYDFDARILENAAKGNDIVEETLVSDLLKSNCLITHQPDWGSVMIRYRGAAINQAALLRYLVSFRHHNEFHEQCVERIFCDIQRFCQPEALTVYARYTRRGGLDINPWRSNVPFTPTRLRLARQ